MQSFRSLFFFLVFMVTAVNLHAAECDPATALSQTKWSSQTKKKVIILVDDFKNQTPGNKGEWLSRGLSKLVAEFFKSGKNTGVIYGLIKENPPASAIPKYIINGSYRLYDKSLNIYIKATKVGDVYTPIYQSAFALRPPKSGRIFWDMAKMVKAIFKKMELSYDKSKFEVTSRITGSFSAYEAYIKGTIAMQKFDQNYIDVAELWFKEAHREDPYFQLPYYAEENMYGYLGVIEKFKGKSYQRYLKKIKGIERMRKMRLKRPSLKRNAPKIRKTDTNSFENRFIKAEGYYQSAIKLLSKEKLKDARKRLEEAAELLPEDVTILRKLIEVYKKTDKDKEIEEVKKLVDNRAICR